jgi:hypothetical protein
MDRKMERKKDPSSKDKLLIRKLPLKDLVNIVNSYTGFEAPSEFIRDPDINPEPHLSKYQLVEPIFLTDVASYAAFLIDNYDEEKILDCIGGERWERESQIKNIIDYLRVITGNLMWNDDLLDYDVVHNMYEEFRSLKRSIKIGCLEQVDFSKVFEDVDEFNEEILNWDELAEYHMKSRGINLYKIGDVVTTLKSVSFTDDEDGDTDDEDGDSKLDIKNQIKTGIILYDVKNSEKVWITDTEEWVKLENGNKVYEYRGPITYLLSQPRENWGFEHDIIEPYVTNKKRHFELTQELKEKPLLNSLIEIKSQLTDIYDVRNKKILLQKLNTLKSDMKTINSDNIQTLFDSIRTPFCTSDASDLIKTEDIKLVLTPQIIAETSIDIPVEDNGTINIKRLINNITQQITKKEKIKREKEKLDELFAS